MKRWGILMAFAVVATACERREDVPRDEYTAPPPSMSVDSTRIVDSVRVRDSIIIRDTARP